MSRSIEVAFRIGLQATNHRIKKLFIYDTVFLGDFNLDINKEYDPHYSKKLLLEELTNPLGHHNLMNAQYIINIVFTTLLPCLFKLLSER